MKKLFKVVAGLVVVVVVLVVAAVIIVPLVVDPNDYKDQIAAAVEEQTGRKLSIEGDIALSLFPWLGVELGAIELGNASGFAGDYFARSKEIQVRVKLLPLITRQVEMDTVLIEGLALNLVRNEQGQTNWDDLTRARKPVGAQAPAGPPPVALALGGLDVRNASIRWQDALAGNEVSVHKLSLDTGPLSLDTPRASVSIEFDVESAQPGIVGHVKAGGDIAIDAETEVVRADNLSLDASLQGEVIPGGAAQFSAAANAVFDQRKQTFSVAGLRLAVPSLALNGTKGNVNVSGDLQGSLAEGRYRSENLIVDGKLSGEVFAEREVAFKLATKLGLDLGAQTLVLEDYALSSGPLSATGKLAVDKLTEAPAVSGDIVVAPFSPRALMSELGQPLPATADPKALSSLAFESSLSASPDAVSLKGFKARLDDTALEGNLEVQFAKPAIDVALAADAIDLDRYLAPGGEAKAASPGAGAAAAGGLPMQQLRDLDVDAKLAVGKLGVAGLSVSDVKASFAAKDGLIKLQPQAKLYRGAYAGAITLDARGEQALIELDEKLAGVRVGEMLKALAIDTGDMDLSDAAGDVALRAKVSGDPEKQTYDLKGASVSLDMSGKALPGGRLVAGAQADLAVDLGKQVFNGRKVNLAFENLKLPNGPAATGKVSAASLDADLASQVFAAAGVAVDLASFKLNDAAKAAKAQLSVARLNTDLGKQTLTAEGFDVSTLGLAANGKVAVTQMIDAPQVAGSIEVPSFNAKELMKVLGQPPIETADPKALTSISLATTFEASANSLSLQPFSAQLDETKVDGTLTVADLEKLGGVRFDLKASSINADRYLPPQTQAQAATPGAAAAALPLELLRGLDVNGVLKVNELIFSNLKLTSINLEIAGQGGQVKLHPVDALLYGGSYAGHINLDARGQVAQLSVDEQLDRVHIGPLLRDLQRKPEVLSGRGGMRIQATASGLNTDEFKRTLNGQAALTLSDGAFKGINLVNALCNGLQSFGMLSGGGGEAETQFAELTASANIQNGVIVNRDLQAKSPLIRVEGVGSADLVRESIDYTATAAVVGECKGQAGLGLREVAGVAIPVRITGSFSNPRFDPDYGALLQQEATKGLQKKLGEKLGIPLPGLGGQSGQQQPQQPQQQQQTQQQQSTQQQAPEKKLEDALKEGLKGLFGQ